MLRLKEITLRRGSEPLLEAASVSLHPGHKVGLTGANGSGKSSLLALLRGELSPDQGEFEFPADWVVAHLAQETPALDCTALDFVLDGDRALRAAEQAVAAAEASGDGHQIAAAHAAFDSANGYSAAARASELLHGLGFTAADLHRPLHAFSGGWRIRLALAQALMCPSDLLLLDEPTNHLDLEAVLWLEQWLRAYSGTLVVIAHDRDFLDQVVDEIVHIEHRVLTLYRGGYTAFERQRAEDLARRQALYVKQQRERAHMQRFIDRFRVQATKARAAQSRIKALERMGEIAPAHVDSPFHFAFAESPPGGDPLLSLKEADLGYGETCVLSGVKRTLRPGERIGLLGPNGAGKSTLVRALAETETLLAGHVQRAKGLSVGYFAQHQLEQLDLTASPLQHIERLTPGVSQQRIRDFLGGFAFHGEQATQPVAPLSGGEKARLVLALLVWARPNLLLLDEPTNHLDLEMRHALTVALQGFAGAVVVVSHDRHLLSTTVERYWLIADGGVHDFEGDLNDYRRWLTERRRAGERRAQSPATAPMSGGGQQEGDADRSGAETRKEARRRQAEQRASLQPLRQRVARLLDEIERLDGEIDAFERRLADPELYTQGASQTLRTTLQAQGQLKLRREALETEWVEAESALEAANATP